MSKAVYATKPTRWTIFMRTFLPWQLWRFLLINVRMISMMRRQEKLDSSLNVHPGRR